MNECSRHPAATSSFDSIHPLVVPALFRARNKTNPTASSSSFSFSFLFARAKQNCPTDGARRRLPRARIRRGAPHPRARDLGSVWIQKSQYPNCLHGHTHGTHVAVHDSSTRINIDDIDDPGRSTRRRRQSDDDDARARLNEQSEPTTMSTARVPLNDGENLAVGAFGGIVETVVQSAYRVSRVRVRRRRIDGWMDGWMTDKDGMRLPFTNGRTTTQYDRPERADASIDRSD